jgi:hypothetical protein
MVQFCKALILAARLSVDLIQRLPTLAELLVDIIAKAMTPETKRIAKWIAVY